MRPAGCKGKLPRFDDFVYTSSETFWFSHAIVVRGYHGSGIGSEELLVAPKATGVAFRLLIQPADGCPISERTWRTEQPAHFKRVSGRGRADLTAGTFTIECVCEVEPTSYEDPDGAFVLFY